MSDASDCNVCPLTVPVTIRIPEHEAVLSCETDDCLCIDSEDEQDMKTSRLKNDSTLLSNAKQLLDYDIISRSCVTSVTQDTDTLSLASTLHIVTVSLDSRDDSTATPYVIQWNP